MKKKLAVVFACILLVISMFPVTALANNGYWYPYDDDGDGIKEYYYVENGNIQTGWIWHNNNWYYCIPERVEDGGYKVNGVQYYFDADGRMLTGWQYLPTKEGGQAWFYFSSSGAMQTGWQKISGKWYYLYDTGSMATGWLEDNGKWYYLTSSGAMATGWQWLPTDGGGYGWFYFNSSGAQQFYWQYINGAWYYLDETAYTDGLYTINGKKYCFAASGKMLTGWQKCKTTAGTVEWFYFDSNGAMHIGWLNDRGTWYYLNESMVYGGWAQINGTWYQFSNSGAWIG